VRGYTLDAAFAAFDEDRLGSIAVGKFADWVALDRDVITCPTAEIWSATVLGTFVGGAAVFEHTCWSNGAPFRCPVQNPFERVRWGSDGCPH